MVLKSLRTASMFMALSIVSAGAGYAAELSDQSALAGVKSGKGLFDMATGHPNALLVNLNIVGETLDGLKHQGVEPDLVVAFRGPAVRFISREENLIPPEHAATAMEIAARIEHLAARGVRFEACGITTRMMKLDIAKLVKGVKPVANTFISLIGYQAKGYALIPVL